MLRKFCLAIAMVCAFAHNAIAVEIPNDFKYKGKAINAKCFDVFGDGPDNAPRDLSKCTLERLQKDDTLFGPDFIGGKDEDGMSYSYYKYLGKVEDMYVIWWRGSGGGSGQFSAVLGVKKKGDTIQLKKEWGGGDRCNGGLAKASIKEGKIQTSVYVTYADLPELVNVKVSDLQSKQLSYGATSCAAIMHLDGDDLKGVTVLRAPDDAMPSATEKCLTRTLLFKAKKQGYDNFDLTENELKEAMNDFVKNCKASGESN